MQKLISLNSLLLATTGLLLSFNALSLPSLAGNRDIRQGLPGRRISGGVRLNSAGSCFSDFNQSLVAMIPRNNLGKTAAEHPTFWFSIPETNGPTKGEFKLFNEAEEMIYSTEVATTGTYGLSEFQLPQSAPALNANANYRWVFSVGCDTTSDQGMTSEAPALELQGWVRRIELSEEIASQLATASAKDRSSLYATAGLWHEQVTELVNRRRNSPSDMNRQLEWVSLVGSTGLTTYISNQIAGTMNAIETTETADVSVAPDN